MFDVLDIRDKNKCDIGTEFESILKLDNNKEECVFLAQWR